MQLPWRRYFYYSRALRAESHLHIATMLVQLKFCIFQKFTFSLGHLLFAWHYLHCYVMDAKKNKCIISSMRKIKINKICSIYFATRSSTFFYIYKLLTVARYGFSCRNSDIANFFSSQFQGDQRSDFLNRLLQHNCGFK